MLRTTATLCLCLFACSGSNEVDSKDDAPDAGGDSQSGMDGAPPVGDGGTESLRLWTFNLLNPSNPLGPGGDVTVRTQMVVDAIAAEQPDLIAFQEVVDSSMVPNRAQFIADAAGYEWTWKMTHSLGAFDEGIAVLSRWPIVDSESRALPHTDLLLFTRYVLGVRVDSPAGEVDFYCAHMTVGGNEDQSADQAVEAYQFVTERSAGIPSFFAGDLNAEPDTPAMRFLRGEAEHGGVAGDFVDSWLATNPGDPGYTIDSDAPRDRIDYLYVAATGPSPSTPRECHLIFDQPVEGVYASDHIGVSCEVALKR